MKLIREFNDFNLLESGDPFQWIKDMPINPWLEYDGIYFDIKPSEEDIKLYINLALDSRSIENRNSWSDSTIKSGAIAIINYFKVYGSAVLGLERGVLTYADKKALYHGTMKWVDYSKLINNSLVESEDPFQWIKDVPAGIALRPNTIYYFNPYLYGEEIRSIRDNITNSNRIKEFLLNNGKEKIKYFVTDGNLELAGWCDTTTLDEVREMYPHPKYTLVDGRDEFAYII